MTDQEFGLFTVDRDTRTVRGILVPWEEMSRVSQTGNKPMKFKAGDVTVPRDVTVVGLNKLHDRFSPVGRLSKAEPVDRGLYSEFTIADTDEGDEWLADHGELVRLSPELKNIRTRGDYGTAELTGAALVPEGAWASAGLFAIGDVTEDDEEDTDQGEEDTDQGEEDTDQGESDTDNPEADTAPAEPDEEPDAEPEQPEEDAVADAVVPSTMLASRRKADAPAPLTKAGFFAALKTARTTGDRTALMPYAKEAAEIGLFALSNVKFDGTGGLVTDSAHPGTWLGMLWQGRRFQRRIVPLLTQGTLTSLNATGWVWAVKPAMAAWAGNKSPVPSNSPTVAPKTFPGTRFAGGHDLAREYYDFNVTDVIEAYADAMVDSYAELSDAYALTRLTAGATVYTPDPANTVNTGLLDIVDGALAVVAAGGTPSWAIVAPDIFKGIIATPREDSLIFLDAAIGLEDGSTSGFGIVPDARLAPGGIIVGDKAGATAWELPGVPIRVQAPDLVLGGVDKAFFGYIAVGVTNPNVIVKNAAAGLLEGVEESVEVAAEKSRK